MTKPSRALAVALGLAVASTALAAPQQARADQVTPVTVVCDDLGEVALEQVTTTSGTTYRLAGQAPIQLATDGLACRRATKDAQGHLTSESTVLVHAVVDTEKVLAQADEKIAQNQASASSSTVRAMAVSDPAAYGPVAKFPYQTQLANYLSGRPGNVAVAWRKTGSSTIYSYYKGKATNVTASIVKVQVMAAVMYRAQSQGRGLSSWEKSQIVPMIRYSDNNATTNLYNHVGGASYVQSIANRMGLRSTVNNSHWGLTVTSAPDQVVLMDHFSRRNPIINDTNRSYGLSQMRSVSSDQDWGVTAGPGTDIAVKNGWLPRTDGWHVNSVGHNHKTPGAYSAAVLTHSTSAGMATQVSTIEGASRIMYSHRNDAAATPKPAPVRGDWNGDGKADVIATANGYLYLFPGLGTGKVGPARRLGSGGWNTMTWLGVPGDVTGDGRSDLMAIDTAGALWLYASTGSGIVRSRQMGQGWGGSQLVGSAGDMNGDRVPDLVLRTRTGALTRYALPRTGWAVKKNQFGNGWQSIVRIVPVSYNADARTDLMAIRSDGALMRYTSTGTALTSAGQAGQGWPVTTPFLASSPGDLNGDKVDDLVLQRDTTALLVYPVVRGGTVRSGQLSGVNLSGYKMIA